MAQSLHVGLCGFSTNLRFGICAIYFHLKVYQYRWAEIQEGKSRIVSWIRHGPKKSLEICPFLSDFICAQGFSQLFDIGHTTFNRESW